jgi:hypothetical protein
MQNTKPLIVRVGDRSALNSETRFYNRSDMENGLTKGATPPSPCLKSLRRRLYRGEIPHKRNSYPGEHPAVVDKPLWDDVQAALAANRVERATGARARHPTC